MSSQHTPNLAIKTKSIWTNRSRLTGNKVRVFALLKWKISLSLALLHVTLTCWVTNKGWGFWLTARLHIDRPTMPATCSHVKRRVFTAVLWKPKSTLTDSIGIKRVSSWSSASVSTTIKAAIFAFYSFFGVYIPGTSSQGLTVNPKSWISDSTGSS